jgi:hypothetical protein
MHRPIRAVYHLSTGTRAVVVFTMDDIVCKVCGTHAASGETFCGGCGAFLEWDGERIARPSETPALTDEVGAPASAQAVTPAAGSPSAPLASQPLSSPPLAPMEGAALAPAIPSTAPEGAAKPQPVAVQPAVPLERLKPAPVPRPSRAVEGAIYCGACGDANAPERRFCRRCGALLDMPAAVVAVRLPWWKRIFGHRAATTSSNGSAGAPSAGTPTAGTPTAGASPSGAPQAAGSPPRPAAPAGAPSAASPATVPPAPRAPAGLGHAGSAAPPAYRPPAHAVSPRSITPPGLPRKGGKLGKGLGIVVLLAVIVFAAVPSLRHTITNTFHNIVTKPQAVALAGAPVARNHGFCPPPLLGQNNATLYWYTRPANAGPESVSVAVAPSFTGTISSVVFTPLVANPTTSLAGPSPHPVVLRLVATPSDTVTTIRLKDPPVLQSVAVSLPAPRRITLKLLSSDAGAARNTCAETGIVFEGKNG